jgi:hypothetical protein
MKFKLILLLLSFLAMPLVVLSADENCESECEARFQRCIKDRTSFLGGFVSYVETCEEAEQKCLKKCPKKHVHGSNCKHGHEHTHK